MRTCACVLETYVRTDSTIYIYTASWIIEHPREWLASLADYPARLRARVKSTGTRDELSITLYLQSEINFCSVRMPVNA